MSDFRAKCSVCGKWLSVFGVTKRNPSGRFRNHTRGNQKRCFGYPIEESLTPSGIRPTYKVVLDWVPDPTPNPYAYDSPVDRNA